jgi:hypothetical protein
MMIGNEVVMEIVIHGLKNLSDKQQNKIRSALANGGLVLDSYLFQAKVTSASYKESRPWSDH